VRPIAPAAAWGLTLGLFLLGSRQASAEWQIKPLVGATFGGHSTFLLVGPNPLAPNLLVGPNALATNSNHPHVVYGVSGLWLGEIFGLEADFALTPAFFQHPTAPRVLDSGVYTLTGNVIVAMPRHLTEYTLRPYLVGGAGLMHVDYDLSLNALQVSERLQAMDLGAGVTGFITQRIGVSWDVRYFRSMDRTIQKGLSFGSEQLSFWRASMAVAIRR
jgi:hypothetical protein